MGLIEAMDLWRFIGGLGIFLLSMNLVEGALIEISGRRFKRFFREYTKTPLRGVLSGTVATAVLQSSSVVTLLVLSFVGAGIIEMRNAIGVILGSNLGTTFTGWVVATLGFELDIQNLSYPLIGIGALFYTLLPKQRKLTQIFRFIAGLGLLFLGLDFMKLAMASVAQGFDVSELHGYGTVKYFIFGFVFTAITQSSSATMMTTLAALNAGIVTLPGAAALVIGADLGTTIKTLLASIGGSSAKKQTSMAHFLFNVVTDVIALAMLKPLLSFVISIFGSQEPLFCLVLFHSSFNMLGILIFIPFTNIFAKLLEKYIGRTTHILTVYTSKVNPQISDAATEALNKEIDLLLDNVVDCNLQAFILRASRKNFTQTYEQLKEKISEVLSYLLHVQEHQVSQEDSKRLSQIFKALDYLSRSIKSAKDIHHNMKDFEKSARDEIIKIQESFQKSIEKRYLLIKEIKSLENQSHIFEDLVQLKNMNIVEYEHHQKLIYGYLKNSNLTEVDIATLLNMNREIHSSTESLVFALKDILLSSEKAEEI